MSNNVEAIVVKTLFNLGISPNTKGYHYLKGAILVCLRNDGGTKTGNRELYSEIAEINHTTISSVERAVRHAIKSGWYRHDEKLAEEIFMNTLQSSSDVPTNSVFISAISEWIRVNFTYLLGF